MGQTKIDNLEGGIMGLLDDLQTDTPHMCSFHAKMLELPDDEREAVMQYVERIRAKVSKHDANSPSISKLYQVLKQNGQKIGKNAISDVVNNGCTCGISS